MRVDNIKARRSNAPLVMVVDDTEGVRKIISIQLRTLGYRVIEAKGGIEAIELMKLEKPSLVLMDINMPEVNGLETVGMIRRAVEIKDIPIIGLSAHHGEEIRNDALASGCDEFVTKPLEFKLLADLVSRHLKVD